MDISKVPPTVGSVFLYGVPHGIRTRVTNVKGWYPKPLDERDIGRGTWNRTKINEFKARCDKPLHYTPT